MVNWNNFETPEELLELYRKRLAEPNCGLEEAIDIRKGIKILHRTIHGQRQSKGE